MYTLENAESDILEAVGFTNNEFGFGYFGYCDIYHKYKIGDCNLELFTKNRFLAEWRSFYGDLGCYEEGEIDDFLCEFENSPVKMFLMRDNDLNSVKGIDTAEELLAGVNDFLE